MTNQSQPLTLKLSNGREVSIAEAKTVLRHTENGQQRSCAIVRGPQGAALYNAEGEIQVNGAPSSAHWLQQGDTLAFGNGVLASVEQLGVMEQAIDSLLNETTPTQTATASPAPALAVENVQDTFKPATAAASFKPELEQLAPAAPAAPAQPTEQATVTDLPVTAAELAIPATSALAAAGIIRATVSADSDEPVETSNAPVGFTLPGLSTPAEAEPASDAPTGFAAELLARIQAEDNIGQPNEDETVGSLTSETTHSPLAADGPSFSSPENDQESISSLIPELPSTSAPAPAQNLQQQEDHSDSVPTPASAPIETSTAESTERQAQSSSVSALLERMKSEGQWGGLSEEEAEEAATSAAGESNEPPVLDQTDEDVQSYMSQLLSRMRDPNEEAPQQASASVAAAQPAESKVEVVEAPKPVGLLKPEEYVPKTKARRLDSLQDMRALANTQTRTAIDRSQAKRREASVGNINLMIAVTSCVAAAIVFLFNIFGGLSFTVAMIAMISGAFFCCKTFFSELLESKKKDTSAAPQETVAAAQEVV